LDHPVQLLGQNFFVFFDAMVSSANFPFTHETSINVIGI